MNSVDLKSRNFLFLQGPHGPFFAKLANMLSKAGAGKAMRVGFNRGDAYFWPDKESYIAFRENRQAWPDRFLSIINLHKITDVVLYGDTRPVHAEAVKIARQNNLRIHVFEEGYLRPYWVTYERGGTNGNSRLMNMGIPEMQRSLEDLEQELVEAPAHWGDMRHHIFYGAVYHWFVMFMNHKYKSFRPHRALTVSQEFKLYLKRLVLMPILAIDRMIETARVKYGGFPYHLVLLQLEHDSSFQAHSPFATMEEFLSLVIENFAASAPRHHHVVFKAHPLEDGRAPLRSDILRFAKDHGVGDRVHYVRGGKLAQLLDYARSAITVNSTAAQQALWRGLPLKALGRAVFAKPEFVSSQSLSDFFKRPLRPDARAYRDYRHYLLETSQVAGGYYSSHGRRQLLRQVVDMMIADDDPYDALSRGTACPRQKIRLVN